MFTILGTVRINKPWCPTCTLTVCMATRATMCLSSTEKACEHFGAPIDGVAAELFLDAQQAVVLRQAFRPRDGADLNLRSVRRYSQICHGRVFGLARPCADHGSVSAKERHLDHLKAYGQGTDLVHLDKNCVCHAVRDSPLKTVKVGCEQVVTDQLATRTQPAGQPPPAFPIIFRKSVLDRKNGIAPNPTRQFLHHLHGVHLRTFGNEPVGAATIEMT